MADIIEVATHEFSEKGLAGARIDVIAQAMRTSKRMIYYYFGSKEGLYIAVLDEAYRRIRSIETELHLDDLAPEDALRKLVGFTVDRGVALEQAADVEVLVVLGDAVCQVAQRIRRDVDFARAQPVLLAGEERPVVTEDVRDRVGHLLSSVRRPSLARTKSPSAGRWCSRPRNPQPSPPTP